MNASTALRPSVRAAFSSLIDYAGLFPPAKLAMAPAVAEYAAARQGPSSWMLGRFIVPASRVGELLERLPAGPAFDLSVIIDAELDPRRWLAALQGRLEELAAALSSSGRIAAGALEVPLPPLASRRETFDASLGQLRASLDRAGFAQVPVYAEIPRGHDWIEQLPGAFSAMPRARVMAKIRCGGLDPAAFPSPTEVAAFVREACAAGVAFKATAGLHHPVRHFNAGQGVTMHGFLNLLAAAAFAADCDAETLERIVAEEDPAAFSFDEDSFSWRERRCDAEGLARVRERGFVGYGSCSFDEPVDDLVALNVLPAVR